MNKVVKLTSVLLLLLLGCESVPSIQPADARIIADTPEGNATLYLIDDSSSVLFGNSSGVAILIDSKVLAQIKQQYGVEIVYVKPGSYTLSISPYVQRNFVKEAAFLDLVVKANTSYYITGGYSAGKSWFGALAGVPVTIKLVTKTEAEMIMKKAK